NNTPLDNTSNEETAAINNIGVHIVGHKGHLIGTASEDGYGTIWGCNVGVEIGTVAISKQSNSDNDRPEPNLGESNVSHVQSVACNSGFRIHNDGNYITKSKAACGKYELNPADDLARLQSSDGFVVGIKALIEGRGCDIGTTSVRSVSQNTLFDTQAIGNNNGYIGGNELEIKRESPIFNLLTNHIKESLADQNSGDGFLIEGTGFILKSNAATRNSGTGINYSRLNPACGPQEGVVNLFDGNTATYNQTYGVASTFSLKSDKNQGGFFKNNYASENAQYSYFEANSECATGESNLNLYNLWKENGPKDATNNEACTLD
ncbi:MAG: hypothetical protein ACHP9Y_01745, partial [Gammaproteobacteria bacterium]